MQDEIKDAAVGSTEI